jgi:hypothetical protein
LIAEAPMHVGYVSSNGRRVRTWECVVCHRVYAQAKPSLFCAGCKREYHRYHRARQRGDSHEQAMSWALKPHRPGDNLKNRRVCAYPSCKRQVKTNTTYALFCRAHAKYRVRYRNLIDRGYPHDLALSVCVQEPECVYCGEPKRFDRDELFCGRYTCRLARAKYQRELKKGRSKVEALMRARRYAPRNERRPAATQNGGPPVSSKARSRPAR